MKTIKIKMADGIKIRFDKDNQIDFQVYWKSKEFENLKVEVLRVGYIKTNPKQNIKNNSYFPKEHLEMLKLSKTAPHYFKVLECEVSFDFENQRFSRVFHHELDSERIDEYGWELNPFGKFVKTNIKDVLSLLVLAEEFIKDNQELVAEYQLPEHPNKIEFGYDSSKMFFITQNGKTFSSRVIKGYTMSEVAYQDYETRCWYYAEDVLFETPEVYSERQKVELLAKPENRDKSICKIDLGWRGSKRSGSYGVLVVNNKKVVFDNENGITTIKSDHPDLLLVSNSYTEYEILMPKRLSDHFKNGGYGWDSEKEVYLADFITSENSFDDEMSYRKPKTTPKEEAIDKAFESGEQNTLADFFSVKKQQKSKK